MLLVIGTVTVVTSVLTDENDVVNAMNVTFVAVTVSSKIVVV